jgi:excisionase family DNA binding protein
MAELIFSGITYPQLLDDIRALLRYEIAQQPPATLAAAEPDQLLTIVQAASLLDVCRQTIHEWKRRGLLPFHKLGKRTYFKKLDLLESLNRHERTRKGAATRSR